MEYWIFFGIIALFFVVWAFNAIREDRKNRKRFKEKLQQLDGTKPDKKHIPERREHVAERITKEEGFMVDDITWNDLSMDQVFERLDYTFSAAGEEMLYKLIRKPELSGKELLRRETYISYFEEHISERVKLQLIFAEIGRTGKYSIYDYLDYLEALAVKKNWKEIAILLAIAVTFLAGFYLPQSFLFMGLLVVYNFGSYLREKHEIEPFLTTFSYILRLLGEVDAFCKVDAEVLREEQRILKENAKTFAGFKLGSNLVIRKEISTGNPLEIGWDLMCMLFHFDLIKFNSMHGVVKQNKEKLVEMFEEIGFVDAMISVALFRKSLPGYALPTFFEPEDSTKEKEIQAKGLYHPLINNPVANEITAKRGVLLTGSNASGKSTFLKTVAINAILSQSIGTTMATEYKASFFRVYSSMSLRDDLLEGDSYFIVEIKAIKRIMDAIELDTTPVLCFVDEVLRGTNTVERIAASTEILRAFQQENALCFAATHDLELTKLLAEEFDNYHFEEKLEENDVTFAYQLLKGEATTRNAIELLRILGFEEHIIAEANRHAKEYLKRENLWLAENENK